MNDLPGIIQIPRPCSPEAAEYLQRIVTAISCEEDEFLSSFCEEVEAQASLSSRPPLRLIFPSGPTDSAG